MIFFCIYFFLIWLSTCRCLGWGEQAYQPRSDHQIFYTRYLQTFGDWRPLLKQDVYWCWMRWNKWWNWVSSRSPSLCPHSFPASLSNSWGFSPIKCALMKVGAHEAKQWRVSSRQVKQKARPGWCSRFSPPTQSPAHRNHGFHGLDSTDTPLLCSSLPSPVDSPNNPAVCCCWVGSDVSRGCTMPGPRLSDVTLCIDDTTQHRGGSLDCWLLIFCDTMTQAPQMCVCEISAMAR